MFRTGTKQNKNKKEYKLIDMPHFTLTFNERSGLLSHLTGIASVTKKSKVLPPFSLTAKGKHLEYGSECTFPLKEIYLS